MQNFCRSTIYPIRKNPTYTDNYMSLYLSLLIQLLLMWKILGFTRACYELSVRLLWNELSTLIYSAAIINQMISHSFLPSFTPSSPLSKQSHDHLNLNPLRAISSLSVRRWQCHPEITLDSTPPVRYFCPAIIYFSASRVVTLCLSLGPPVTLWERGHISI